MADFNSIARHPNAKDETGSVFGPLTVLKLSHKQNGEFYWLCRCECGNTVTVNGCELRKKTRYFCSYKCGFKGTHRHSCAGAKTREYRAYRNMLNRCNNRSSKDYRLYGGRGIRVCQRWQDSVLNFLSDMGPHPGKGFSIDRIDSNGNYEPGNCRWASAETQARNTSRNVFVNHQGVSMTLAEWGRAVGLPHTDIYYWMRKYGMTVQEACDHLATQHSSGET